MEAKSLSSLGRCAAAIAAAAVCSFGAGRALARDPSLLSLAPEHFKDTATLETDPRDGTVAISTQKGFVDYSGPLHMVWHDEFLTALIDKKTGDKSFQVHVGNNLQRERAVLPNRELSGGQRIAVGAGRPRSARKWPIAPWANASTRSASHSPSTKNCCGSSRRRMCRASRPFGLSRSCAKSGPAYAAGLSNAEITGLLVKVDENTHTPTVVAASAAGPPIRLDLGVGGMAVAATAEQSESSGNFDHRGDAGFGRAEIRHHRRRHPDRDRGSSGSSSRRNCKPQSPPAMRSRRSHQAISRHGADHTDRAVLIRAVNFPRAQRCRL